ncbi:MAG: hypothetical protein R3C05_04655 [Pirellulaceae bacterium]
MMDKVRKKVLLDLFASPWSVIPIAGGMSAWLLSWAMDGQMGLNMAGLIGVMGGIGVMATRVIFGLEKITQDAFEFMTQQQKDAQERKLDELTQRLAEDGEPKTEAYLTELRHLYQTFLDDLEQGKLAAGARPVSEQVHRLFQAAVRHLEYSLDLWRRAKRLSGSAKEALLEERRNAIDEVGQTIEHLGLTIHQFHAFRIEASDSELSKLRKELEQSMMVARRAEERISGLGSSREYDPQEFQ